MKNIKIERLGRFGNLIIQLKNALYIAIFHNYNIVIPEHPFLNTTYIIINKDVNLEDETITDESNFFYKQPFDNSIFSMNHNEVKSILKNTLVFSTSITPLNANDLVIHIRSGDLFSDLIPHPRYLPPPLSYYVNIIEGNKEYENIYLVAEDRLNPCINKLLELYPKIKFNLQSLEEDIKLILRSTNIVISFGTFVPQILQFSGNIKNVYCPSYFKRYTHQSKTHISDLEQYYSIMMPWKNTLEQNKCMLEM